MALADVYDALISKRIYKDPLSHEDTRRIINEGRGKHFDPEMLKHSITVKKRSGRLPGPTVIKIDLPIKGNL